MPISIDAGQAVVVLAILDGMTQHQLAAKSGVSTSTLSAWSKRSRSPSPRTMAKVLRVLSRTQDEVDSFALVMRRFRHVNGQTGTMSLGATLSNISNAVASISFQSEDEYHRELGRTVRLLFHLLMNPPEQTGFRP